MSVLVAAIAVIAWTRATGLGEGSQRAAAFVTAVAGNLAVLIASRSMVAPFWRTITRRNPAVPLLELTTIAILAAIVAVPGLRGLFAFAPTPPHVLAIAALLGIIPVLALDALEALRAPRARG